MRREAVRQALGGKQRSGRVPFPVVAAAEATAIEQRWRVGAAGDGARGSKLCQLSAR